jgi:lipid-binding SYLF domain-containing protein
MKHLAFVLLILLVSCGQVSNIETKIQNKKEQIRSENIVTDQDALQTLAVASRKNRALHEISQKSIAQIVFPKVIKAGLFVGANYGEGFLVKDGQVIKLVDLKGGNFGLQAGAQSYSQVTYILSEARYQAILQNNRMSLNGSISYGLRGQLQNSRLSSDSFKGDLFTVVFNETGTVYGASLEGLYYSLRE